MKYDASISALLFPEKIPPLFKTSRDYTPDMIAVESARLSYFKFEKDEQSRRTIESALAIVGYAKVEYFSGKVTGAQAFAALHDNGTDALIAFRGTQPTDIRDVTIDLEIPRSPWPQGGSVHTGFARSFEEIWDGVSAWHERNASRHTFMTGHSLGAGLATLCATRFNAGTLVTIGSSRVGDAAFASLFGNVAVHRYVGCCDIVTSLPTEHAGFMHVGDGLYIDRSGAVLGNVSPAVIADDRQHAHHEYVSIFFSAFGNVPLRDLADHTSVNYISAVLGERDP
jgi:Lipase (class 3)